MENQEKRGGNVAAIVTMFALFFMIAFVTNFAQPVGVVVEHQFKASKMLTQLGSAANFLAYLFMGIPGGLILKRKGYKFTAITAILFGLAGLGIQLASGYIGSFAVYVAGAFIAGFSMCMLNLVTDPLLNALGGGGDKGNQLIQFGCSCNSIGGTLSLIIIARLLGENYDNATVAQVAPAMWIAIAIFALALLVVAFSRIPEPHIETAEEKADRLAGRTSVVKDIVETLKFRHFTCGAIAIFFYIVVEVGIPSMALLYMADLKVDGALAVAPATAGIIGGAYWFCMGIGRFIGGAIGAKVSARAQLAFGAFLAMALIAAIMFVPVRMVTIFGYQMPISMAFMVCCGFCTSIMWGNVYNLAAEGLGRLIPMASGIFMAMVFGGVLLPLQGKVADGFGILNAYWVTIGLLAYIFLYALVLSRPAKR